MDRLATKYELSFDKMPPFVPPPIPPALIETSPASATPPMIEVHNIVPLVNDNDSENRLDQAASSHAELLGNTISVSNLSYSKIFSNDNDIIISPLPKNKHLFNNVASTQWIGALTGKPASENRYLVTQERGGEKQEFSIPLSPINPTVEEEAPTTTVDLANVIELIADQQEYDALEQVIIATGKVEMRFANAVLLADLLRVNLANRIAVAQGNVVLKRGEQIIRGDRFEYYLMQDSGIVLNASGQIFQKSTSRDFSPSLPTDENRNLIPNQTLSDRLAEEQPLQNVTPAQGFSFVLTSSADDFDQVGNSSNRNQRGTGSGGNINRVRFEAEKLEFDSESWRGENVRLTNDPFSPPEVEIRAEKATFRNIAPLVDELTMTNSRLVLDQENSFPTFQDRLIFDRRDRQPGYLSFGYDGRDRGGFFVERGFTLIDTPSVSFELSPQYLIQKVIDPDGFPEANPSDDECEPLSPCAFGLITELDLTFSERTTFRGIASFASLNLELLDDHLRSQLTLQQKVGPLDRPHDFRLQYNYRERLFNGSLGFQTVNNSFGGIVVSPIIPLWNTGLELSYQGSIQSIFAPTDRQDLLISDPEDNLVNLVRYQGAASLSRPFRLWQGSALSPTAEEGLRYTPRPVVPFFTLLTGITGVSSLYSNGDSQPSISGNIGFVGQLGHFSRSFFDYTGFNLVYSTAARGDESPFLFDRFVDTETLRWGITQQIYGPVRFGVQSSLNLDTGEEISTDYFLEYSRRTFNLLLRYNPELQLGSFSLRISDFNWTGNPGTFEGLLLRPVVDGVTR